MPLRTNVLRRRPLAVTSPFTSYARASALRSEFVGASLKADCSQPYPPHAEPRRGGQGVGQSKGGGDGQRPAPGDICPGPCLSRRGPSVRGESGRRHACGGFILRGAGRMPLRTNVLRRRPLAVTSPFTSYARASARRSEFVGASLKADCSQPYPPHAEPRRGGQGVGQSKGGGDGQRPAPGDICPGPCLSRRGPSVRGESGRRHACGGFILRGAGRMPLRTNVLRRRPLAVTSPFTSYARASARRSEFVGASLKGGRACCAFLTARRASSGRAGVWAK